MTMRHPTRREFLALMPPIVLAVSSGRPARLYGCPHADMGIQDGPHPDPRPGIDASKVLPGDELSADVRPIYDGIREVPEIADGIRCYCGCAAIPGYYSLLTCYEEGGMAQYCEICQGQGRLVVRLHNRGRSLEQIRELMTARFG